MTPEARRQAEEALNRSYYTIAAACRILCVSKATMRKWLDLHLIQVTELGPPGYAVRKIAKSEIERLRRVA